MIPREPDRADHQRSDTRGARGYAEDAKALIARYERVDFLEKHGAVLHHLPPVGCRVLDVGAGTGRDAAWLAARGDRVIAVEPTEAFRAHGMAAHASPSIEWVDDSLPDLPVIRARGEIFRLIMITAVWMHLDEGERQLAMSNVATLLEPGGVLILSLRHGPPVPGRSMFDVSAGETVRLAGDSGLQRVSCLRTRSAQLPNRTLGIEWSRLVLARPPASPGSTRPHGE